MKILIVILLAAIFGGCISLEEWEEIEAERRAERRMERKKVQRIEEIDHNTYLITDSLTGGEAADGDLRYVKEAALEKAREHCAKENKAIKVVSMTGESRVYADSSSSQVASTVSGLYSAGSGSLSKGAEFDLVFQCRER